MHNIKKIKEIIDDIRTYESDAIYIEDTMEDHLDFAISKLDDIEKLLTSVSNNYNRLKQALIDVRDFRPEHCRGDFGLQMEQVIENINETTKEIKDLLT